MKIEGKKGRIVGRVMGVELKKGRVVRKNDMEWLPSLSSPFTKHVVVCPLILILGQTCLLCS